MLTQIFAQNTVPGYGRFLSTELLPSLLLPPCTEMGCDSFKSEQQVLQWLNRINEREGQQKSFMLWRPVEVGQKKCKI